MSVKHRRIRRKSARRLNILLTLILLVLILSVGICSLFRSPEQKGAAVPPVSEDASAQAQSEAEAEALRSHLERKDNFYTVLVSGVDDGNGGSDTNILVAVDAAGGSIYGVSIPRDTHTYFNGKDRKINSAYSIGGMELLSAVTADLLGIPVDYTVKVDLQGFEALVDALGGVYFDVPLDMDYDDPYQDLAIHVAKGYQRLSGADALGVVRFRHNNDGTGYGSEDLGRMQTQQNFLKAVAKQTLTVSNLDKVDDFVKLFRRYVETDLTLGNLAWLGREAIDMGVDSISFSTLPGEWKSPYIHADPEAVLTLVNEHLNPYVEDRTPEDLNFPRD